jgi:hypothetical protein
MQLPECCESILPFPYQFIFHVIIILKNELSVSYYPRIIIIINILTAIGLAPGGSSPVHIYREHYVEYTNNTQNT